MSHQLSGQLEDRIRALLESPEKLSSRAFLGVNAALDAAVKLQRVRRLEQEVKQHELLQIRIRLRLYDLCRQLYNCNEASAPWDRLNFGDDVLAYGIASGALRAQHTNGGLKVVLNQQPAAVLPSQATGSNALDLIQTGSEK